VFARLLDQDAGHFSIRPAGELQASCAYLDQTMALQTTFTTSTGTAVLTDAMAVGRNDRGHDLGDVGLLAEEVDPGGAEVIGNYPQAFSHIGLINAAWAISQAEERSRRPAPVTSAGGS
jgi:hypothetical protein